MGAIDTFNKVGCWEKGGGHGKFGPGRGEGGGGFL